MAAVQEKQIKMDTLARRPSQVITTGDIDGPVRSKPKPTKAILAAIRFELAVKKVTDCDEINGGCCGVRQIQGQKAIKNLVVCDLLFFWRKGFFVSQ